MKKGCFLVEFMPEENGENYEYLYQMKKWRKEAGLEYYAKVAWKKGNFVANTGRKSKNTEEIAFFTKGKARNLRPDAKKDKAEPGISHYMSGARGMLPTVFDIEPPGKNSRIHQGRKTSATFAADPWICNRRKGVGTGSVCRFVFLGKQHF